MFAYSYRLFPETEKHCDVYNFMYMYHLTATMTKKYDACKMCWYQYLKLTSCSITATFIDVNMLFTFMNQMTIIPAFQWRILCRLENAVLGYFGHRRMILLAGWICTTRCISTMTKLTTSSHFRKPTNKKAYIDHLFHCYFQLTASQSAKSISNDVSPIVRTPFHRCQRVQNHYRSRE